MIRLIITDDHPIIRDGIKTILADAKDIKLIGCASDGAELMEL
ncbi:MAG: DNA-binding response regulator, partial [Marinilabiliales bacterium]